MNVRRMFISIMMGLAALKCATMIYAAIENPIIDIETPEQLNDFKEKNSLVVVEFHDLDCPVCQAFQRKKIFQQTATALPHIKLAKVSVQNGSKLHGDDYYAIHKYPTFIFFRNGEKIWFTRDGKEVDRFLGYVDNPIFTQKVSAVFAEADKMDIERDEDRMDIESPRVRPDAMEIEQNPRLDLMDIDSKPKHDLMNVSPARMEIE